MKKFISAITSLGIAASMIGAVVPATAGAADASKGFAVKTYDIAKPSSADAASTVTIKKSDIPADGYVLPSALYYSESANGSTDSLLVGITTDSKDISFKLYNPEKDGYTKSEQEYTLGGTKFSTSSYISFAGSYDDLDGYMPQVPITTISVSHGQTTARSTSGQAKSQTHILYMFLIQLSRRALL